jgi:hypothetical protein
MTHHAGSARLAGPRWPLPIPLLLAPREGRRDRDATGGRGSSPRPALMPSRCGLSRLADPGETTAVRGTGRLGPARAVDADAQGHDDLNLLAQEGAGVVDAGGARDDPTPDAGGVLPSRHKGGFSATAARLCWPRTTRAGCASGAPDDHDGGERGGEAHGCGDRVRTVTRLRRAFGIPLEPGRPR